MSNFCKQENVRKQIINYCELTEDDYFCQIKKLLNLGSFWCIINNEESNFSKLIRTLSNCFYEIHEYFCQIIKEADPCTTEHEIDNWIKVFGLDNLICQTDLTKEVICQYYMNSGTFNCDIVTNLAESEGYEVLECETICDYSTEELIRENKCKHNFGAFPLNPNTIVYQNNTECEIQSLNSICENCCVSENLEIDDVEIVSPCINTRILGGCKFCGCEQAGFYFKDSETYNPLCLPSTIKIKLSGLPPCAEHINFNTNFNRQFYSDIGSFSICSIEAIKPLHINIIYEFENQC